MVDINDDGLLDIFVNKSGFKDPALRRKILYINNGNGTFTDKAAEYGLDDASFTIQSYFFDNDNDGDKDVFFVDHPDDFAKSMTIPVTVVNGKMVYVEDTASVYVSDRLFENRGGKFVDVTKEAGLIDHAFGLSASIADINNDGWPDIYVANDFNKPDFLYINNRNGTFTNRLTDYIKHVSFSAMGSDISDLNRANARFCRCDENACAGHESQAPPRAAGRFRPWAWAASAAPPSFFRCRARHG